MLTRMTDEDCAIVLKVFEASRSRRGDKGRDDRKFLEALHHFCGRIFVEDASLVSLNPEADQIARDVVALRQAHGASRRQETPDPPGV